MASNQLFEKIVYFVNTIKKNTWKKPLKHKNRHTYQITERVLIKNQILKIEGLFMNYDSEIEQLVLYLNSAEQH